MKLILTVTLSFWLSVIIAQLPSTSIHQFKYVETDGGMSLLSPKYLTDFNPGGYNNQPSFFDSDNLIISSNLNEPGFTDIVKLNLRKYEFEYLTKTKKISEFSPTKMPNGTHYSVIRQEGEQQLLWAYPFDGKDGGYPLLKIEDVGYHFWLNENQIALFRVTDPISFSIASIESQRVVDKLNNIGRCFKMDSEGNLLFVQKINEDFWYLKKYNLETDKITVVTEIDVEDFEVLPSGSYLKASKGKLYRMTSRDDNWKQVADLEQYGLNEVNRMAVYRNKLILVSND